MLTQRTVIEGETGFMILYQLRCGKDHEFEAWFKDGQTCDRQLARKIVECPICGNKKVAKALMAPRIGASDKQGEKPQAAAPANPQQQGMSVMAGAMRRHLQEIRSKIEDNCDYVGDKFADEARKIHYGETESRGIYGEATDGEHQELVDEGIDVARVPWLPRSDA